MSDKLVSWIPLTPAETAAAQSHESSQTDRNAVSHESAPAAATPRTDAASFIIGYGHIGLRVCGTFNMAELEKDLVAAQAQIDALRAEIPEGCTPADAAILRKANHDLAIELSRRGELLKQMYDLAVEAK